MSDTQKGNAHAGADIPPHTQERLWEDWYNGLGKSAMEEALSALAEKAQRGRAHYLELEKENRERIPGDVEALTEKEREADRDLADYLRNHRSSG